MIGELLTHREHPGGPTVEELLVAVASNLAGGAHRGAYRIGSSMSVTEVEVIRADEWVTLLSLAGRATWTANLAATKSSVYHRLLTMAHRS